MVSEFNRCSALLLLMLMPAESIDLGMRCLLALEAVLFNVCWLRSWPSVMNEPDRVVPVQNGLNTTRRVVLLSKPAELL